MSNQNTHQYSSRYFTGIACILSLPLLAQSAAAEVKSVSATPEEIIVTSAKREQSLQDFSGAISVVKTDSLNPGASLSDLANEVPGLSVIENGPRNVTTLVMRGLRMDAVDSRDAIGDGSGVASYVDNIPLQGFFVPPSYGLKDLQQVEVLRGPQGTLYGNASVGGLIRYITAKPDLTENTLSLTTGVSQTAESHGLNYDTDLVANMPLIEDELAVRLLLAKKANQGFIDNDGYLLTGAEDDINTDFAEQVRASVLWQPSAEFSLNSSYEYQKNTVKDLQASNEEFTGDKYGATNRYAQPMRGVLRLAGLDATYQFDSVNVTASLNRYDYIRRSQADQTDYLLVLGDLYGLGFSSYDEFSAFTASDMDIVKDSAELRFESSRDDALYWLAGAFYTEDDLNALVVDRVPGYGAYAGEDRVDDIDYYATQEEKLTEQAYYLNVAYDISHDWEVELGARYFREKDNATTCSLVFPGAEGCAAGDDVETGWLGKVSSIYKINDDQSVYLAINEGFRRGGTNFLPVEIAENRSYKADTNVNYEIGSHSSFFAEKVKLNAAIFYIDWKKIQVKTATEDGYGIFANAGTARSSGVELDTSVQLTQELSTTVTYSFTDAELSETVNSIDGYGTNAYAGDRLPGSPREQVSLGFNYSRTVNTAIWDAALNYAYNTGMTAALNDGFMDYTRLDGYGMINAKTGVSLESWKFGLYVNNLANTRAITGKRLPFLYGEQGQFENITRPRTIGLTLNYHF